MYEPIGENQYTALVEKWFEVGDTHNVWLGIIKNKYGRTMSWFYVKSLDTIAFSFWKTNEPTIGNGDCVLLIREGEPDEKWVWVNTDCATEHNFICEFVPSTHCTEHGEIVNPNDPKQCCMEDKANAGQCEGNIWTTLKSDFCLFLYFM